MNFSEVKLPSNRKFGFFFTFVFVLIAIYFFKSTIVSWAYIFVTVSLIFLFLTLVNADILLPLNKLWMRFGFLLGMIVSPIVLGIMYFGLFMPIAFVIQISGRDELRLKFNKKPSHWISRNESIKYSSFKQQF